MRNALAGAVVPLLWAAGVSAQQRSCDALPVAPGPVPPVTATVRGEFLENKTVIQDLYLSGPDGIRIRAFLIKPYHPPPGRGGAALFLHWLGGPPANDRAEFFEDAMRLADHHVTSLLVDAPWAEPEWFPGRKLTEELESTPRYAAQFQSYFRYLMTQAQPDPEKVALIGHDFGGMYGALVLKREPAIRHAVVMAAVGDFADWFVLGRKFAGDDSLTFRRRMEAVAPTRYLECAGKADLLFQFARNDRFVSQAQADRLVASAAAEKKVLWYPGGHELQDASRADRLEWLIQRVGSR